MKIGRTQVRSLGQLHLITDTRLSRAMLLRAIDAAVDVGVDVVQVREKSVAARDLFELVCAVKDCVRSRAAVIVNDRIDVAAAAQVDGVHLAAKSLTADLARLVLGPGRYIGVSVHSRPEAEAAERDGADSVTFGHIYNTSSHPDLAPRGLASLRDIVSALHIPVIAIGGITSDFAPEVLAAGASGVAVISAILEAADPSDAARSLRAALDGPQDRAGGPARSERQT